MAFCKYCGKQLNEGEVCDCEASKNAAATAPVTPVAAAPVKSAAGASFGNMVIDALGVLKSPVTKGAEFASGKNLICSLILIGAQALITGLFTLLVSLRALGADGDGFNFVASFFLPLLFSLIFSGLFILIVFGALKIAKADCDIKQCVDIVGVKALFTVCATVVSLIVGLISPGAGIGLFFICGFALIALIYGISVKKFAPEDNKFVFAFLCGVIIFFAITLFITYKVGQRSIVDFISAKILGSFSGLFGDY